MSSGPGHIELARSLDSIHIGRRHRKDLGDIDALAASIDQDDLLQLITIDPDGNLVCGLRRYTAMRKLGRRTTNVWVRTGISDRLSQLLAERDDDALHKPLTQTEAASLFRELKALLAEDAARRQEASRFTSKADQGGSGGGANLAPPSGGSGKARAQAAQMVTGRNSYTTLERINRLQDLAADPAQPDSVRTAAAEELARIDAGAGVISAFQRVGAAQSVAELERLAADPTASDAEREQARGEAERLRAEEESAVRAAELERLAAEALARVRATGKTKKPKARPTPLPGVWERRSLRAFTLTWDDLASWWEHYDPADVGPALTDEQWDRFEATVAGTVEFAGAARTARAEVERRTA